MESIFELGRIQGSEEVSARKPVAIEDLCRLNSERRKLHGGNWRRECDWDPTVS